MRGIANFFQVLDVYQSPRPDSAFFFKVGKMIKTDYYYTSPAPMESLPIFWQKTKLEIQKNPEKNDSLIFAGLSQFCDLFADGHTYFLSPARTTALLKRNQFTGIGIQLAEPDSSQKKIKSLRISKVFPDSPAERAGLKSGDCILEVNQKSIGRFKSFQEAIEAIRGEAGTEVNLTIWRKKWPKPKIISLVRATVFVQPVNWRMIDDTCLPVGKVVYLELNAFNSSAVEKFSQTVSEILENKPKAIILDLRDNPGGELGSVEKILSHWISGVSYKLETRSGCRSYRSGNISSPPRLKNFRTVVLTNQGTASASELLIGALKDYDLATLVGEKTYGKGCYQRFILMPFGTSLGVTNGLWLTPKGKCIDKKGFIPDIEIKFDQDLWLNKGIDNQLQAALDLLKK